MRRKDREITEHQKITEIIAKCHCCRLGFCDDGEVYIVPLNFGYVEKDSKKVFYFHGAKEGRKIDLIAKTQRAGFELDTNYMLHEADIACKHSARFQSIIGTGKVMFVDDLGEKEAGLQAIMRHNTGKGDWEFSEAMLNSVCVFKLEVDTLACKEHL